MSGVARRHYDPSPFHLLGNITSPTDPTSSAGKYPNGVECTWSLNAEPGFHAELRFYDRFDVEDVTGCANDYVEVSDFRRSTGLFARVGQKLCGRQLPPPIATASERSRVVFRSNRDVNGDGFKVGEARLFGDS